LLAKSKKPMTRGEMSEKTGIQKGWAALLGPTSKGGDSDNWDEGLEARKLVKSSVEEGVRGFQYQITKSGVEVLKKHVLAQKAKE
jgi:hypothetical protein